MLVKCFSCACEVLVVLVKCWLCCEVLIVLVKCFSCTCEMLVVLVKCWLCL